LTPVTWGMLAIGGVPLLFPEHLRPSDAFMGVCNGIGFVLLGVWLCLVTECIMRRSRIEEAHGRLAPWRHPSQGLFGRVAEVVANSWFLRGLGEWLPLIGFRSDIRDVIYCNYLVEAERLLRFVPRGLELQRLGANGRWAMFSFLSYRHGHFGPALLGPLRRL